MLKCHHITPRMISKAHRVFVTNETLYIFYDFARTLVKKGWQEGSDLSLTQGISVLLQTWNKGRYQRSPFNLEHFRDIRRLVTRKTDYLRQYSFRRISSLTQEDLRGVKDLFIPFEKLLGPVGTAKALHILAPDFFSLWDNPIAIAYGLRLHTVESKDNGARYFTFMRCQQEQSHQIGNRIPQGITVLKAIDEYNYARFTKGWI